MQVPLYIQNVINAKIMISIFSKNLGKKDLTLRMLTTNLLTLLSHFAHMARKRTTAQAPVALFGTGT